VEVGVGDELFLHSCVLVANMEVRVEVGLSAADLAVLSTSPSATIIITVTIFRQQLSRSTFMILHLAGI
jgi:hypothetical protein